jgi:hypothetical protein
MSRPVLAPIVVATVIAVIVGVVAAAAHPEQRFERFRQDATPASAAGPATAVATPSAEDLDGFPIYPGARFVGQEAVPPCEEPASGYAVCDATVYTWRTGHRGDRVVAWYAEDQSGSGWTCGEQAGERADARALFVKTTCRNGEITVVVFIQANGKRTTIRVAVPAIDAPPATSPSPSTTD